MDDLISEFLSETSESLAVLDTELVKLERDPADRDILSTIYKLVHTIKGTCGFLELKRLEAVAAAVEDVLAKVHSGAIIMQQSTSFVLLQALACIRHIVNHLAEHGTEPEGDDAELLVRLKRIATNAPEAPAKPKAESRAKVERPTPEKEPEARKEGPAPKEAAFVEPEAPMALSARMTHHPLPATVTPEPISTQAKQSAIRHGLEVQTPQTPSVNISRGLLEKLAGALADLIQARNQLKATAPAAPLSRLNSALRALKDVLATTERETAQVAPINVQSVLVAYAAGQALALPQRYIMEVIDLSVERNVRIETINHTQVLIRHKRVMPLVKLRSLLKLSEFPSMREDQVVVMRVGEAEFGLVIERVGELTEVVLEKMPRLMQSLGVYQGAALVDEQKLMVVMDAAGMARIIGFRQVRDTVPQVIAANDPRAGLKGFLIFRAGDGAPKALLVDHVVRIDGMANRAPDIRLATLPGAQASLAGEGEVVVLQTGSAPVAIAVDKVIDVLHAPYTIHPHTQRGAYLGTVELPGMTAELVNIDHFIGHPAMEAA